MDTRTYDNDVIMYTSRVCVQLYMCVRDCAVLVRVRACVCVCVRVTIVRMCIPKLFEDLEFAPAPMITLLLFIKIVMGWLILGYLIFTCKHSLLS